jgi:hypothetical protein
MLMISIAGDCCEDFLDRQIDIFKPYFVTQRQKYYGEWY